MDVRHDMVLYCAKHDHEGEETQYISVFFQGIGNMTITFERRTRTTETRPVISLDFAVENVDIIDARGNDRSIT